MFPLARFTTVRIASRRQTQCFRKYSTPPPDTGINVKNWIPFIGAVAVGAGFFLWPVGATPFDMNNASTPKRRTFTSSRFTPSTVFDSDPSGPDTKLITLKIPTIAVPQNRVPSIWSVFIKDDDIQVERPYTPLEGIDKEGNMLFWIKKYPHGEVGRWLHSKQVGDRVELRGPLGTWEWKDDKWDDVVMISGGTGITPFYQLFYNVISKDLSPSTRFTLIHSSPTLESLPPSRILSPMLSYESQHPERLRVHLHVDAGKTSSSERSDVTKKANLGRIDKRGIEKALGKDIASSWWGARQKPQPEDSPRKILFLVCGPEPMITAIAGPLGRNYSQGPVGGVLKEMGYTSSEVTKLA